MSRPQKRALITLATIAFVAITTLILGAFARGYRFDLKKKKLKPTGLLVANSIPNGAQVWIDGKLKTATDQTITLSPGKHTVEIKKPGYSIWKKSLQIGKEVAVTTDAYLFPIAPDLKALNFTGVTNPRLSPDGTKVIYFAPPPNNSPAPSPSPSQITATPANTNTLEETGLEIIDLTEKTLGHSFRPRVLVKTRPNFNFNQATVEWSPDSRMVLLSIPKAGDKEYFLLNINQTYDFTIPPLISAPPSQVSKTIAKWHKEKELEKKELFSKLPKTMTAILKKKCQHVTFSPKGTKVLYQAIAAVKIPEKLTPKKIIGASTQREARNLISGNWYVYDAKEDKNFLILKKKESKTIKIKWFPTSRHLLLIETGKKIDIIEYDGTNRTTVYAGPFENSFVFPFPSGKNLLISTSLNNNGGNPPHLYAVSLQ